MRIALINGSPKINGSASSSLLHDLKRFFSEKAELTEIGLHEGTVLKKAAQDLMDADIWVFSCPLYVDGIPGHLLSCLMQLEKTCGQSGEKSVYGIVNCGFYEGIQAECALRILQNWCVKAGFIWGGGIGVGGGGLAQMPAIEGGHGPKAPVEKALELMAEKVLKKETQENRYVSAAFPRYLYKMAAQTGWRQMIRANGGRAKDLGKRPDERKER